MSPQPTRVNHSPGAAEAALGWRGQIFGLDVHADHQLPGLNSGDRGQGGGPSLEIRRTTHDSVIGRWEAVSPTRLLERRYEDGRLFMSVDRDETLGYLIDADEFGIFQVGPEGATLDYAVSARAPAWTWYRPLFSQALPTAAALRGHEPLHASAVKLGDRAIGVLGHSGAGKTSLALHLVDRGAELLADDVLAIAGADGRLLACPGVPVANIAEEQLSSLPEERRGQIGALLGKSDKLHMAVAGLAADPCELLCLYFLKRSTRVDELAFRRLDPVAPARLLGASFVPHVQSPTRVRNQLEVCARLSRSVAYFELRTPAAVTAAELAHVVHEHAKALST